MSRRHSKRSFGRRSAKTWEVQRLPTVGDYGMSVFRAAETRQLDGPFEQMLREIGHLILHHRRNGHEKPMAVTLIELGESKRQLPLADLPIQTAIDEVYDGVGSLRRPMTVRPERPGIYGLSKSPDRTIGITFDEESTQKILHEREQIHEVMQSLGQTALEFSWHRIYRPHISLARLPANRIDDIPRGTYAKIAETFPEEISLQRATLHNPASNHRPDYWHFPQNGL